MKDNKSKGYSITYSDGSTPEITKEGSLGLLAAGYKGILLWRQERNRLIKENQPPLEEKEK